MHRSSEISPDSRPDVRESRHKPLRVRLEVVLATRCVRDELIAEIEAVRWHEWHTP